MRLLVVEDYPPLRLSLVQGLREAGYSVDASADGTEGLRLAQQTSYDVLLLDWMLPGMDGITLVEHLRRAGNAVHILMLTAKDTVPDRVAGLGAGADDYLVKPFAFPELLARLQALTRRAYGAKDNVIRIADLEIDTGARHARRAGQEIELTAREFALLEVLARRTGDVVSRQDLWEHCYDFASEATSNVVDVYIGYLRRKLEPSHLSKLIHTRRGQGYVLAVDP